MSSKHDYIEKNIGLMIVLIVVAISFSKDIAVGRAVQIGLTAEFFNLLGDDTVILGDRIAGINSGVQRFGRRYQLGARVSF